MCDMQLTDEAKGKMQKQLMIQNADNYCMHICVSICTRTQKYAYTEVMCVTCSSQMKKKPRCRRR